MIKILAIFSVLAAAPVFAQIPSAAVTQSAMPQTAAPASAGAQGSTAASDSASASKVAAPAAQSSADLAAQAQTQDQDQTQDQNAPAAPSTSESWATRWNFLQAAAKNSDYSGAEPEIIDDLNALVAQNPSSADAPQARYLAASLEEKEGLHNQAMIDLLHLLYESPSANVSLQAQSMFQDIANTRLPSRYKSMILSAAQASSAATIPDRLAALVHVLAGGFGSELYDATRAEIRGFMARFPDYAAMDQVQWDLVKLHEAVGNNRAALLDAQEFLALYPQSLLASKARYELGTLYENLKLYEKAVGAYQSFATDYPQSPDAVSALAQIATIFAEHLGQYDMAVKTDEMIITRVPQGQRAATALYQESGIYDCRVLFMSCKLDDASKALSVYQRLVDTGNIEYLEKGESEHVRSRINSLTKTLAKEQAQAPQAAAAPASGDNQ